MCAKKVTKVFIYLSFDVPEEKYKSDKRVLFFFFFFFRSVFFFFFFS